MANPLPNEEELYRQIEKEKIRVHPIIWEILNHHIRNDLNHLSTGLGLYALEPRWLLKIVDIVIAIGHKLSGQGGCPPPLKYIVDVSHDRCKEIDKTLKKMYRITYTEEEKGKNE